MSRVKFCVLALASVSRLALATAAHAQPNAQDKPEEVIVTAQKREQKLQDVPIAITVVGGKQLQRDQVYSLTDLDRTSPAVEFYDGAPGGGAVIRGIGTQSFVPSSEASVGIVVDGVPQGNVNTSNLFDLARVEVLRGPQGTLFGQSASAGVINEVTNAPVIGRFAAKMHADAAANNFAGSNFGNQVLQGMVNIPIDDHSALRLVGFGNYEQDLRYNRFDNKQSQTDDNGFRARYLNNITDDLTANLILDYDHQHQSLEMPFSYEAVGTTPASGQIAGALAACGITASFQNKDVCSPISNFAQATNDGASLQLDYKFGDGFTLTAITALRQRRTGPTNEDITSLAGIVPQLYDDNTVVKESQLSQEVRLSSPVNGPLEYVAGLYYSSLTAGENYNGTAVVLPFGTLYNYTDSSTDLRTVAAFGQATYHILPNLSVLAGLRATREFVYDNELFYNDSTFLPHGMSTAGLATAVNNLSGKVGIQYKPIDTLMLYGTVSRGYKGPQVNDTTEGAKPLLISPELPTAYEIGAKGELLDHRLDYDANLFDTDVKDYQGQVCITNPNNPALQCGPDNVPHVISRGAELDVFGRPIEPLSLNIGAIYNPVKYPGGFEAADSTDLGGEQITGVPKVKLTISGEYTIPINDSYEAFIDSDSTFKSRIHVYPSASPLYDLSPRWITSLRVGVRMPARGLSVSIFARNLTNTPQPYNIYPGLNPGDVWQAVSPLGLRVVGLSFDAAF